MGQVWICVRFGFGSVLDLGQVWIWFRIGFGSGLDLGQVWIRVRFRFGSGLDLSWGGGNERTPSPSFVPGTFPGWPNFTPEKLGWGVVEQLFDWETYNLSHFSLN